jgi:hypothetical protein
MRRALLLLPLLATPALAQANRFEPNQTRRTAARVQAGDYKGLHCDQEDWYAVELGAGQRLEASIAFRGAQADLDLEAHDARGRLLGWSRGQTDEEAMAVVPLAPGTIFLRVHVPEGGTDYDLHLGVGAAGQQGAETEREVRATCWGSDWYPLEVPAGESVRADLSFKHADGDLDLALFDPEGNELASSSGETDREELRWGAAEAKQALLHVRHVHRARSTYQLRITLGVAAAPDLTHVLRVERPEGAGNDLIELRGGDTLQGTVLTERFRIVTPYADLDIPAKRLAGLDLERKGTEIEAVVTVDEDRFSGFVRTETLRVKLPALDQPVEIRRERLVRVVFGRRGEERTAPAPDAHRVVLQSGDEFTARLDASGWTVDLGFAALPIAMDQIESLAFEGDGVVNLVRPDRTVVRGRLRVETVELEVTVGDAAQKLRLHPDRLSLIRRGQAATGALGPAEMLQIVRLLAPTAPRELVRDLTESGATVERVNQLRTLVTLRDDGCAQLERHVLAIDDRPMQWAWLEVLLKVDKRLRDRLVRLCGEEQEDRRLRIGGAQALVELAQSGGPMQPLEQCCQSPPAAEVVFGIIMATSDDVLMQRLMPMLRGGWRGGRAEAASDKEKELLCEQLQRLLGER